MSKTITLRLNDSLYQTFRSLADRDNRPLSNFIETAALRYIEGNEMVDDFEMNEIRNNNQLNESLKRALKDVKDRKGRLV